MPTPPDDEAENERAHPGTATPDPAGTSSDRPAEADDDKPDRGQADTPGGQPPEDVEDRPMVGSVTPEDYPER